MKAMLAILTFFCISFHVNGQEITGRILDSVNATPLEYASVGILHTHYGTITNQEGWFHLEVPDEGAESLVRISMIGYKSQTFSLEDLLNRDRTIQLIVEPYPITELTITPLGEAIQVGSPTYSRLAGWCGWGGSRFGKGHEIGTRLDLGKEPVHIRKLHVHVQRQAYDTSWYRLHIRSLEQGVPDRELLNSNVIVSIDKEKGWAEMDLATHNIVLQGEVAVTLEWLKITGINEDRAMKINDKVTSEYVLFNTSTKQGCIYTKWGVEANWNTGNKGSPAMYLTVQQ